MKVVISQPSFFPWVGTFEKIRNADIYVHYDDVQFSKGSFTNRVQIKTPKGRQWLTVPLCNLHLGQLIKDVSIDQKQDWRKRHLALLHENYRNAPYKLDMLEIVEHLYSKNWRSISNLSISSLEEVCTYFGISPTQGFIRSSQFGISSRGSQRVLDTVLHLGGTVYICGPGNQRVDQRYLDHAAFEQAGVRVEYMKYCKQGYRQLHGEFTPAVSTLDLIANMGKAGTSVIASESIYWKEFDKT